MLEPNVIVVVAGTFLLAGTVKGVIGLGLPAVTLGVLTVAFDLPSAMSLLLVPSFVTNLNGDLAGNPTDNPRPSRDVGRYVGWSREWGSDWYDGLFRRARRDVSS